MTSATAAPIQDLATIRREQFPVTERYIYLNHAALGPLPRCSADVLPELAAVFRDRGIVADAKWMPVVKRTRQLVPDLLCVQQDEIAFTRNTSHGLSLFA